MRYSPFGTPIPPYEDEDETSELETCNRIRNDVCGDILNSPLIDLAVKVQAEEELAGSDSAQQSPAGPCKRAQRLSGLAGQIAEDGKLLVTENGQAFAYQEDGGYFRPVPNLSAYVANFFPKEMVSGLLERDVHEIVNRLPWDSCIRCNPDDFNHYPEMVNLANGVFNLKTSELLPHDASFRFTYQVQAEYLKNPELVCPSFDQFCKTSLEGDEDKRTLLLEFIGYIGGLHGLRVSEILGLRWRNVDLENVSFSVVEQLPFGLPADTLDVSEMAPVKAGERTLPITKITLPYFQQQRHLQEDQKRMMLSDYHDNDLVVAKPNGTPEHRGRISANFAQLLRHLNMPHIRFHDTRHSAATVYPIMKCFILWCVHL